MTEQWMIQISYQNKYAFKKAMIVEAFIEIQLFFNNFAAKSSKSYFELKNSV